MKNYINITYKTNDLIWEEEGSYDNPIHRVGFALTKNDADNKKNVLQGDATHAGAVFEIYNISRHSVWVDKDGDGTRKS